MPSPITIKMSTTKKNVILTQLFHAPCGVLVLGSIDSQLCLCDWLVEPHRDHVDRRLTKALQAEMREGPSAVTERTAAELGEYFAGQRRSFDIPLRLVGTPFQQMVWRSLLDIAYGQTRSYADIARSIGRPTSVRAVANANGANALSILVPCHRVIGSDRSLTGYGGGLEAKHYLLTLEGIQTGRGDNDGPCLPF